MRTLVALTLVVLLLTTGLASAEVQVQTSVNYDWWEDTKGNKESQIFVPVRMDTRYRDFSIGLLAGYANTSYSASGEGSPSVSHLLDTKLTTSYEIVGKLPVDILLGIDFNFPTGKTNLSQRQVSIPVDSDLITVTTFGEGFNVNPTISVAKAWGTWAAGFGIGYLWRGQYDYSKSVQDYDPGDILNVTVEARYFFSPGWYARLFGEYAHYTDDEVRDDKTFQEGDFSLVGFEVFHSAPKWDGSLMAKGIFRAKNRVAEPSGGLDTEDRNSHGTEWHAEMSLRYFLDSTTKVLCQVKGLYITDNDYPSDSPFFIGDRRKISLGLGASKALWSRWEGLVYLKGFYMADDVVRFPQFLSARDYRGFSLGVQLSGAF